MSLCDNFPVSTVRRSTFDDIDPRVAIIRGLPDYFTDDVPEQVARDLARHQGWVIADGEDLAGFVIVDRRSTIDALRDPPRSSMPRCRVNCALPAKVAFSSTTCWMRSRPTACTSSK